MNNSEQNTELLPSASIAQSNMLGEERSIKKYVAGNWLRSFYEGEFSSIDEAWSYLSKRFLLSYPSDGGRYIYMFVEEENKYGIKELVQCKDSQLTEINDLPEEDVMKRCKRSIHRML